MCFYSSVRSLTLNFLTHSIPPPFMLLSFSPIGNTAYTAAVLSDNRVMTRFLLDVLFFNFFPYWTPAGIVALQLGGR